jgi:creatinine amidohydrolase
MTKPPSRFWDELTWPEFQALDAERTVAVLPMAATEQHGPHLPLSVDATINRGILARALELIAEDLPILVLPPISVGYSEEHTGFPGTLSLSATTLQNLCLDIGRSVHRAGLRKLVLFNSHGGQPQVAQIVARNLRSELAMLVTIAHSYGFGEPPGLWPEEEQRHGIHGGASETSQMLHLQPGKVRRNKLANFPSTAEKVEKNHREFRLEGVVGVGWQTQDLNPLGACGDATLANAEAGRAIIEQAAVRLAVLLAEVSAYPLAKLVKGPGKP